MANTKSAIKQVRVNGRKRVRNKATKSLCRTTITKAEKLIIDGELDAASQVVAQAVTSLDKAAKKGVIHPNNAARRKSRLMKKLNNAVGQTTVPQDPAESDNS